MTGKKTKLQFAVDNNSNISADICKYEFNPERGNFYDIVFKAANPTTFFYDMNVYVKVKPWNYSPSQTTWGEPQN